jgi:hypothetical protein
MYTGTVNGASLGFDQSRQSLLLSHPIDAALGVTGSGPVRGASANLAVQLTVDMSYSPDVVAGRRRRRAARDAGAFCASVAMAMEMDVETRQRVWLG